MTTKKPTHSPAVKKIRKILEKVQGRNASITLRVKTNPKLSKKCPYHGCIKHAVVQVKVNYDYIKEAKKVDAGFEPSEDGSSWGEKIPDTCLLEHNGNLYIDCWYEKSLGYVYLWPNGEPMSTEDTVALVRELPDRISPMAVRRYKLENILEVVV